MKVFIVGLGLIGASYAERLKKLNHTVDGFDKNEEVLALAKRDQCIESGNLEAMKQADIVIIALYPKATMRFIKDHLHLFQKGQIITDVSGVKHTIVPIIETWMPNNIHYVSHHPMAGKETSGYNAKNAELFQGANAILIETAQTNFHAKHTLKTLLKDIGFTSIITATPEEHDEKIAFISQLPHALAMALMAMNTDEAILSFSGNSFRDLTRIASINKTLWTELFLENKTTLTHILERTIKELTTIKELISNDHQPALENYMQNVKEKRDNLGNR